MTPTTPPVLAPTIHPGVGRAAALPRRPRASVRKRVTRRAPRTSAPGLSAAPKRPTPLSAYDSQKRCLHAAHLIASGGRDAQITAATGLNLRQVQVVRAQYRQGRSGANGLSAAVSVCGAGRAA